MKKYEGLLILVATVSVCFLLSLVDNAGAVTTEETEKKVEEIGEKATEVGEKAVEAGEKAVEAGEKAVEEGKEAVEEAGKAVEEGKKTVEEKAKKDCGCGKGTAAPITASLGLLAFIRTRIRKD